MPNKFESKSLIEIKANSKANLKYNLNNKDAGGQGEQQKQTNAWLSNMRMGQKSLKSLNK